MNPIDLTTVAAVNEWLNQAEATDATIIQTAITNFSQYVLTRTGRRSLSSIAEYANELYSGNGRDKLFLRDYPIKSVTTLIVNGQTIPESTSWSMPGWVIDPSGESCSLVLRGNPGRVMAGEAMWEQVGIGSSLYKFWTGILNVEVDYTAGYTTTPFDLQQMATQLVATMYRRKEWLDQVSQMQPNVGTTAYSRLEMPPECASVINRYTKRYLA